MKTAVNHCPECECPIDPTLVPEEIRNTPEGHARVGICNQCGHLLATSVDDPETFLHHVVPRDWFLEYHSDEERKEIHKLQEAVHFKLGQWG